MTGPQTYDSPRIKKMADLKEVTQSLNNSISNRPPTGSGWGGSSGWLDWLLDLLRRFHH